MNDLKIRFIVLLNAAWRQRYIIVLPILILPVAGYFIGKTAPENYVSHTSMLIQETAKMNPFLEDIAVSTMLKERLNALSTLLKSRHVLTAVASDHQLINDAMLPVERDRVINRLASNLTVSQPGKDFLKITLSSPSPLGMKELLESISDHFIEQLLAPERSSISDSTEFLAMHIEQRKRELEKTEIQLANFKNQFASVTPQMQNQSLSRLAALKQSLAEKQAELSGVKRSLGSLDQQLSRTNPVVGKIEEQIIETRSELTLLRAKYTNSHSAVQGKERELRRLESERNQLINVEQPDVDSSQLWDIASSSRIAELGDVQPLLVTQLHNLTLVRSRYESLTEETKSLQKMIEELELAANQFGDRSRTLFQLERETNLKRQLYDELVQRYEMAQLTGSLGVFEQGKRVKIIDLPYTPSHPSNLPIIFFVLAGLVAGIGLGGGIATFLELFNSSVRRSEEIEAITGAPILTYIPKIK